ncbi:MAG TPA: DUF6600 domain-containing protein [Fimbriimonadaceae bacterium]|nr:DUF6600 domain-containing protein [Fimbriimonadaceae bacterium]
MKRSGKTLLGASIFCVAVAGAILTGRSPAHAQGGYQIGEKGANADAGPVRLARFSYLSGPVTWRPADSGDWSRATMNLPLRQGAQVWVKGGSRSELQFDDGSTIRLGGGAVCSLQTLYSDDRGEFTEIKLNDGLATLHTRSTLSDYQIDTPLASVKCTGPAEVRVGVGNTVEVASLAGDADVEGRQGQAELHTRQRLDIADSTDPYRVTAIPVADNWDRFNDNRDVIYSHHNLHVPRDIDLVAGDLDDYGTWHDDPDYGYVWAPRVHEAGWRPYHHGHWVWVSPWGWTWVGDEDWGWAPYHYGTWIDEPYGWAWCPGPAVQYWSPAVVDFVDDDPYVGWVPLAPAEVVYPPALNIGFHSGNWWLDFSIGGAGAFFPAGPRYCVARPWDNVFVNREVNVYNVTNVYGNAALADNRYFVRNSPFIPRNATRFGGMTVATRSAFLNGGRYQAVAADPRGTFFHRGRSFASQPGRWQMSGPPTMRPTRTAFSPTRQFARAGGPPANLLRRNVVRERLPVAVAGHSPAMSHAFAPALRQARIARGNAPPRFAGSSRTHFTATLHNRQPVRTGVPIPKVGRQAPVHRGEIVGNGPRYTPPRVAQPHRNMGPRPMRNYQPRNFPRTAPPRPTPNYQPRNIPRSRPQPMRNYGPRSMPRPRAVPPRNFPRPQPTRNYGPRNVPRPQTMPSRPSRPTPQRPPNQGGGNRGGGRRHHGGV